MTDDASRDLPRTLRLGDLDVTFRRMAATDRDRLLVFTGSLPERSLLFLPTDITRPEVIDRWIADIESERTVTILAEESNEIIGYGSLHRSEILWTRHLGEIRLLVSPNFRGRRIGSHLGGLLFETARRLARAPSGENAGVPVASDGLLKLVVNMMSTQRDAQSLFHHLGFIPEAMLHDWAIDRSGRTHDLIIMSRELEDEEVPDDETPVDPK